jgi:hypothetical protein
VKYLLKGSRGCLTSLAFNETALPELFVSYLFAQLDMFYYPVLLVFTYINFAFAPDKKELNHHI